MNVYQEWKPNAESLDLLEKINNILEAYRLQGYDLTLRQLYYQLVSKGYIPNTLAEYNKIGNIVNRGRLAGLIDWDRIEDRVRVPVENTHWDSPEQILRSAINGYYISKWDNQERYIEVWCEKDAVSNIIEPVCRKWDVLFMANRGYSSQSAMYRGARRMGWPLLDNRWVAVIYLGDHDPSGIDMTRDIEDRLNMFLMMDVGMAPDVDRLALNMDQVQLYNPPNNPAKITDSRFKVYVQKFGQSSWELDALEPSVLSQLVEDKIKEYIDMDKWNERLEQEEEEKDKLRKLADLL